MTAVSPASQSLSAAPPGHIIDVLIEERAPRLAGGQLWPVARPLLYALLDYRQARDMADVIAALPGVPAFEHVSRALSLKIETRFAERAPATGRLVAVSNHPTGIGDAFAAYEGLKTVRPDVSLYANADAHRICPGFGDLLIPVEWVEAKRTRESARRLLARTRETMEAERALVVFPAGRMSRRQPGGRLSDPPWASTAVATARRHRAPVLPIHMAGPWSTLFHLFHQVSTELRDITLFHELLNKKGRAFRLTFGPPIPPEALGGEAAEVASRLKRYVEEVLPADPDRPFA
jgi:putative hemolysin